MIFGSFIILSAKKEISIHKKNILETSFSLPRDFKITEFVKSIVAYSLIIEFIGAVLLVFVFWGDNRVNPVWSAIFHSISAFCTAGFSLYTNSFQNYSTNPGLYCIISILSILGAIGYIVMVELWLFVRRKKTTITFTSKVILTLTFSILILGTVLFFSSEHAGQKTLRADQFINSFFQTMTAITTTGFHTIPMEQVKLTSLFLLTLFMITGSSPSGTGGGMKSTTISSLVGVIKSVLSKRKDYIIYTKEKDDSKPGHYKEQKEKKNILNLMREILYRRSGLIKQKDAESDKDKKDEELKLVLGNLFKIKIMNRVIPYERIIYAICIFAFYIFILAAGFCLLLFSENLGFRELLFEAVSALGTVGLSVGITSRLGMVGKIIIIFLMFIGRIGPITFGMALFYKAKREEHIEDIVI